MDNPKDLARQAYAALKGAFELVNPGDQLPDTLLKRIENTESEAEIEALTEFCAQHAETLMGLHRINQDPQLKAQLDYSLKHNPETRVQMAMIYYLATGKEPPEEED